MVSLDQFLGFAATFISVDFRGVLAGQHASGQLLSSQFAVSVTSYKL
jgi:hypothetical protein